MKKILLLLVVCLCASAVKAQNAYERDTVIQVPNLNTTQIYEGLRNWFITSFKKDSRDIIQIDDPQNGSIIAKLHYPFVIKHITWAGGSGVVEFVLDLKIRDGRFKIKLRDFFHTSTSDIGASSWSMGLIKEALPQEWEKGWKFKQQREVYKRLLPDIDTYSTVIISGIDAYMQSYKPSDEEDW